VVKHGYTMTSPIGFDSVIVEIAEFSKLNPTHFPIIISIENHCNELNQGLMAQSLRTIIGNKLFLIPELCSNYELLPSPNQLRGRILLQGTGSIANWRPQFTRIQTTPFRRNERFVAEQPPSN